MPQGENGDGDRLRGDAERHPADLWPKGLVRRADRLLTRVGARGPLARDCFLAVCVALLSTGLLWAVFVVAEWDEGLRLAPWVTAALTVLVIAQSLTVCLRRTRPRGCLSIVAVFQVAVVALLPADAAFTGFAPFVAAYTCATLLPPRRLVRYLSAVLVLQCVAAALVAGTLTVPVVGEPASPAHAMVLPDLLLLLSTQATSTVIIYFLSALIGSHVAVTRRYRRVERLRADEVTRTQRARADAAIRAERARMARELHDVTAHHLSGMVVQAGAVERLIGRDEDAAREGTSWIRSQGKETLDSLRLIVSALRESTTGGEHGIDGAPVPGLAVLGRLVRTERDLGGTVELAREGREYELPPIADVTFYRVAQEALSNARDHAPGAPVRVILRYAPTRVEIEVVNGPGRDPGEREATEAPRGLGLIGMRERAQLVGATLEAGPTIDGGWRVQLALPVGREVAEAARQGAATSEGR